MENEIEKSRTEAAKLVIEGPLKPKPVALVNEDITTIQVASMAPKTNVAQVHELFTLRKELMSQVALRA